MMEKMPTSVLSAERPVRFAAMVQAYAAFAACT